MRPAFLIIVLTFVLWGVQRVDSRICLEAEEAFGKDWDCVSGELLGHGVSSTTFLIQHTNGSLAVLKKTKLASSLVRSRIKTEVELFPKLNNKYIIKRYLVVYLEHRDAIYQMLEYAAHGSLDSFKEKEPNFFENPLALLHVCHGIASGLKYLHSLGIIHGDLKTKNIVLTEDFVPKLIDFDLAKEKGVKTYVTGTPRYLDPRFFGKENMEVTYDEYVDIYALGTTLYLLNQEWDPAFPSDNPTSQEVAAWVLSEPYRIREGTERTVAWIIQRCRQKNPEDRPTIDDILRLTAQALEAETVQRIKATDTDVYLRMEIDDFELLPATPQSMYERPWGRQTYECPKPKEIVKATPKSKSFSLLDFFDSLNFLCNKPRKRVLARSEEGVPRAPHTSGFGWMEVGKLVAFFGVVCLVSHLLVRGVQRMWSEDNDKCEGLPAFSSPFEVQGPRSSVQPTLNLELSS